MDSFWMYLTSNRYDGALYSRTRLVWRMHMDSRNTGGLRMRITLHCSTLQYTSLHYTTIDLSCLQPPANF